MYDLSSKTGIAKTVATFVVGSGCYKATGDFLRNNFVVETNWDRVRFAATSFAVGGVVANAAKEYTERSIDQAIEGFYEVKKVWGENKDKLPSVKIETPETPETTGP